MIHSMSGGVLSDGEVYTFVKVEIQGETHWYLSREAGAKEGGRAVVPFGKADFPFEGTIVKVEKTTLQCAPVPAKHLKEVLKLL